MEKYLESTQMLNYNDANIQKLIINRNWQKMIEKDQIFAIYNYVRDEIVFGYNVSDNIKATDVLRDGYGQCNTKSTLFMALLRAVGIACRIHGFYIDKVLQKGAMKGFYYRQSPKFIVHTWVEILYNGEWLNLEGFILDKKYLNKLQIKFKDSKGSFCGYGVAISDFQNPPIEWNENDTYIQKDGITKDFGVFNNPDEFFAVHKQNLGFLKKFLFMFIIRHLMNRNINKIRTNQ
jgi:predicted nucleic acid-binding Zn ribbon protein